MIKVIHLEGKFILVDDEYVLSVQASIISTKDEDGYIPNEFFEFVKILDEDEFEIDEVGANSNMRCDSLKSLMIINKLSKFL